MARELVTLTWCDLHQHDTGERVKASTWTVAVATPEGVTSTWEIDVCESCAKRYRDLVDELGEFARPVKGSGSRRAAPVSTKATPGEEKACPVAGCDYVTTAPTGLTSHAKSAHGQTIAELTGAASLACPADGCERKFGGAQGLASHLRTVHDSSLADYPGVA